jgi:ketosteroid isomerase-like protein
MTDGGKRDYVEAVVRAVNARDLDTFDRLFHPEIEFRSLIAASEGEVYRGAEGLRAWIETMDDVWSGFRLELTDLHDAGGDDVVVVFRLTGVAKGSGVPLDSLVGQVWTWRDGRPWRNVAYSTPGEAYAAVGLRE